MPSNSPSLNEKKYATSSIVPWQCCYTSRKFEVFLKKLKYVFIVIDVQRRIENQFSFVSLQQNSISFLVTLSAS